MKQFRTVFIALVVLLVVCFCGSSYAQIQSARIIVKGVSPDLMKLGRYDALSSGLANVGKGQKVWLEAQVLTGTSYSSAHLDTITSQTWSITGPPGSLLTAPIHTDTTTYFVPDTTGTFHVTANLTTANGNVDASLDINVAYWVGTGSFAGTPVDGQCALGCHSDKVSDWQSTPHAHIFSYEIDSSTHYTTSCVSCHTVGYDTSPTAVNGGWDDVAADLGFTLPPPHPGAWDSIKTNFPSLANLSNIQCENCHGPGSLHNGDVSKIAVTFSAEVCTQCHGAATHHIKGYEWNNSVHSHTVGAPGEEVHMNSSSCSRCHTANGYVNDIIDGNASAAPYADPQPVTCQACHDPHNADNPSQLRSATVATACDNCHITRLSSHGMHHSHQSPMLTGADGIPYTGTPTSGVGTWGGWQLPGYAYTNSSHSKIAGRCADCHMATTTGGADTSMVPLPFSEWQGKLGGHTFRVVWDHDTPDDPSDDVINPFGCKECHGTVSLEFVEQSQAKIKTLLEQLRVLLPHNTSGDTTQPLSNSDASLTAIQQVGSYNYYFVLNDGSYGVHNYEYASGLLKSSIQMLQLGAGAADIASIADVPNDQGKQVQIVWNKFPAENYPDPVTSYLVLRQDSATGMGKAAAQTVAASSFREMLTKVASGSRVMLDGSVWTKVGEYKAISLPQYSLVVPTLFDSTIIAGPYVTTFEVVGYTAANVVYASLPMGGYSIDNLAPAPPSNVVAQSIAGVANLTWDDPIDADFQYFAVYRSTTPNFTPSGSPLATTTVAAYNDAAVTLGNTYYYKIAAFDFSGNESNFSEEKSLLITSVDEAGGIPTEYALRQNHPNPFNPTTSVKYQIPEASHVKITVYNTLGKLVTTLIDRDLEVGYYTATWNGRDHAGNTVASGIYLYKMEAGQFSSIKKMVLMK